MANIKISELNNISEINSNDIIPIVDISADETKKISMGNILDLFYPVGSYYETSNTTFDPNVSWGGTWVEDTNGLVTVALDENQTEFNSVGKIGGSKEMQAHSHSIPDISADAGFAAGNDYNLLGTQQSGTTGTGDSGNLQPYIVVKRWHRTA